METATSAFNVSALAAESASQGQASSDGGVSQSESSAETSSPSQPFNNAAQPANTPPQAQSESAETIETEEIDPEVQALNDAQDRRLEDQARISHQNYLARERLDEDFARRYGPEIKQLDRQIAELKNRLENSSRGRLFWMKMTGKISRDPETDLRLLRGYREEIERTRTTARELFEGQLAEAARARQAGRLREAFNGPRPARESESQTGPKMTRARAKERIEFLEEHRAKPAPEPHLRPGGKVEEFVNSNVASKHETEIARLKAFIHGPEGPNASPNASHVEEIDDGLELSF